MDLLEKFNALKVEADTRISPLDKEFCEKHQRAYEAAIQSLQELSFFWADMEKAQREALAGLRDPHSSYMAYLTFHDGDNLSTDKIDTHIESLHRKLISNIVYHFNTAYKVSIPSDDVMDKLLPREPDSKNDEADQMYHKKLQSAFVQYEDVLEQIIFCLDGRSFSEQAFYELAEKCHKAAWSSYDKTMKYERKKNAIRFIGYYCNMRNWGRQDEWALEDKMKTILRSAAHFETGCFDLYPLGFSDLLAYSRTSDNEQEFPTCKKVQRLKMFKNGRVDLYFSSEAFAEEFANKYLGTVC